MTPEQLLAIDREHIWHPYSSQLEPLPVFAVHSASGVRLRLADGRELIDGMSSWWTAIHGYNHPALNAAATAQMQRMSHVMFGGLTHEPAIELCRRLVDITPAGLEKVFICDSGSVAVEVAIKMALQYQLSRGDAQRRELLTIRGGYHGDTFATMALCDPEEGMHHRFGGMMPEPLVAELPTTPEREEAFRALLDARGGDIAGVIVEPLVQAAGGFLMHAPEVLRFLRRTCDEHGVHLVFDEIAVGFGRVGAMFACQVADVVPDVITLSKALTGGTAPLAATVATRDVFESFLSDDPADALMHGPTYMAHALGCAAALGSVELFDREPRLEQARSLEGRLAERLAPLAAHPRVVDVRCLGGIGVVEVDRIADLEGLRRRFVDLGCWIRPLGRCIYLMPALLIEDEELDLLARGIETVLPELP